MKRHRVFLLSPILLTLLIAGCVVAYQTGPRQVPPPPPPPRASSAGFSTSMFYDSLDPYGDWIWSDSWGFVWVPSGVPVSWRPYWDGQWVWTDDGWFWASDEPWAWAAYHYGRWTWVSRYGWIWVPGRDWAPAWVAWRAGDGWIGWAPLPPDIGWRAGIGLAGGGVELEIDAVIRTDWWCFVDEVLYIQPGVSRYVAPAGRNVTLVRATRNVTRYVAEGPRIVNRSIEIERIERASRRPVPKFRTAEAASPREAGKAREGAREVLVYRPPLAEAPADAAPRRVGRGRISRDDLDPKDRIRATKTQPVLPPPAVTPAPATPPSRSDRPTGPGPRPRVTDTRKYEEDQRRLEREQAAERARLERQHAEEDQRAAAEAERRAIQERQEQEHRLQEAKADRERRLLEERAKREADRAAGAAAQPPSPKKQEEDKKEGKDDDGNKKTKKGKRQGSNEENDRENPR